MRPALDTKDNWEKLDDNQYARELTENSWEFWDGVRIGGIPYVFQDVIDLDNYGESELEEAVEGFYDSLSEVKKQYGEFGWKLVVAEILAEKEDHVEVSEEEFAEG